MPEKKRPGGSQKKKGGKVGSSESAAKQFGGEDDFGISPGPLSPEQQARRREETTGRAPVHGGEEGTRVSGVGSASRKPGQGSGGDVDTDFTAVTGGGVSASGEIHEPPGPDDTTGQSDEFASGPPAKGKAPPPGSDNTKIRPAEPGESEV